MPGPNQRNCYEARISLQPPQHLLAINKSSALCTLTDRLVRRTPIQTAGSDSSVVSIRGFPFRLPFKQQLRTEPTMAPSYEEDKAAILAIIQSFLDCLKNRTPSSMRLYIIPEGGGVFERPNQIITSTLSQLVERMETRIKDFPANALIEEAIYDPVVMVDENLGMAWTPFKFTIDGKLHHSGTNVIVLLRTKEGWKISGTFDNHKIPQE